MVLSVVILSRDLIAPIQKLNTSYIISNIIFQKLSVAFYFGVPSLSPWKKEHEQTIRIVIRWV